MEPYYTIMKLPGEAGAEFIQMLPFTPRQKDNLAAWMVARSDGENYGQLVVFQFPKQTVIYGPRQVVARINQDQVIAPQITLWNQQGSEVIQGKLLVIPIEESLLYIRPLYLRAAGGRIPELKRVIVAYQNQIVMEETLEAALARLFPTGSLRRTAAAPAPARFQASGRRQRRPSTSWRPRRKRTTSARCRRSATATGRSTAKRSSAWARCWSASTRGAGDPVACAASAGRRRIAQSLERVGRRFLYQAVLAALELGKRFRVAQPARQYRMQRRTRFDRPEDAGARDQVQAEANFELHQLHSRWPQTGQAGAGPRSGPGSGLGRIRQRPDPQSFTCRRPQAASIRAHFHIPDAGLVPVHHGSEPPVLQVPDENRGPVGGNDQPLSIRRETECGDLVAAVRFVEQPVLARARRGVPQADGAERMAGGDARAVGRPARAPDSGTVRLSSCAMPASELPVTDADPLDLRGSRQIARSVGRKGHDVGAERPNRLSGSKLPHPAAP